VSGAKLAYLATEIPRLDNRSLGDRLTLALSYDVSSERSERRWFVEPNTTPVLEDLAGETYIQRLIRYNQRNRNGTPNKWTILLAKPESTEAYIRESTIDEILPGVLVLKRVLELIYEKIDAVD
jgi:hypothetical protein